MVTVEVQAYKGGLEALLYGVHAQNSGSCPLEDSSILKYKQLTFTLK